MLVGSANLTRQGLFKNDETVARAAPEEFQRIRDELTQSMQRSWDAKGELMARLGQTAADVEDLHPPARGRVTGLSGGCRRAALTFVGTGAAAAALILGLIFVLPWLVGLIVDRSTDLFDTSGETQDAVDSGAASTTLPAVGNDVAADALPSVTTSAPAATEPAQASAPSAADGVVADTPAVDEATIAGCPYGLPDGGDACGLLEALDGVASTPCESLPVDARPLSLRGDANPAGYLATKDAPNLVCAWIDGGTFVAGDTIPAGDLRAMNATVWGNGACQFEVYDEAGEVVASRAEYGNAGWTSYALLRLSPAATIRTDGCGWVPAEHAGLARAADGVIKAVDHTGRSYPLVVGVDVPPGNVRIECDFWAWPNAEPDEHGSWVDALRRREVDRRAAGPYRAESGIIWPKC